MYDFKAINEPPIVVKTFSASTALRGSSERHFQMRLEFRKAFDILAFLKELKEPDHVIAKVKANSMSKSAQRPAI